MKTGYGSARGQVTTSWGEGWEAAAKPASIAFPFVSSELNSKIPQSNLNSVSQLSRLFSDLNR